MHLPMKNFTASGHKDDTRFTAFSHGDTVLNYVHVMYKDFQQLEDLVRKELDGGAGAETTDLRAAAGLASTPAGAAASRCNARTATRSGAAATREYRERMSALSSMAASSASMPTSSARSTAAAMIKHL